MKDELSSVIPSGGTPAASAIDGTEQAVTSAPVERSLYRLDSDLKGWGREAGGAEEALWAALYDAQKRLVSDTTRHRTPIPQSPIP